MTAKLDAENLTPAQKAARTRAANKKLKADSAAVAAEVVVKTDPFTESINAQVDPVVQNVIKTANEVINSEAYQVTASKVTPKIPASVRNVIYNIGFYLGIVATIAPSIIAALTGQAAVVGATVLGIVLVINNALSKANLSKTATDIAKEETA